MFESHELSVEMIPAEDFFKFNPPPAWISRAFDTPPPPNSRENFQNPIHRRGGGGGFFLRQLIIDFATTRMYTDDTNLTFTVCSIPELQEQMSVGIQCRLENWLIANKLTLNIIKTEFMLVGSREKIATITVNMHTFITWEFLEELIAVSAWACN